MNKTFIKGFKSFKPHQNAPAFVKGQLIIDLNEFREFIKSDPEVITEWNGKQQIKIQITESREGALVFSLDTFKPEQRTQAAPNTSTPPVPTGDIIDDLPF